MIEPENESGLFQAQEQAYWELYRSFNLIYGEVMPFDQFIVWMDERGFSWQTPLENNTLKMPF